MRHDDVAGAIMVQVIEYLRIGFCRRIVGELCDCIQELGLWLRSLDLVSSRLVRGDKVDSGEYQVMGLLRRKFIFSFCDSTYLPIRVERGGSGDL